MSRMPEVIRRRLPGTDRVTGRDGAVRLAWVALALVLVGVLLVELASTARPLGFSVAFTLANGISIGAVYALVALGVALVYKATRVINFAQGALGSLPALVALWAMLGFDLHAVTADPTTLEFLAYGLGAVLLGAALAVAMNLLVIRQLANAAPVTSLVATTGIALLITAVETIVFQVRTRRFPRLVEGAPDGFAIGPFCFSQVDAEGACVPDGTFAMGGLEVPWNTVLIVVVLLVVSLSLAAFFRSPAGVALLATAQEPFAAELYGVSPRAMSSLAWGIAGGFAALAGILGAGVFEQAFPGFMTRDFLIPALVAAVLGGVTSMVGAVVGGLLVGIVFAASNAVVLQLQLNDAIPGPPQLGIFLVLVLTLLVRPRGLFGKDA